MKTTTVYKSNYRSALPYPNAITRRQAFHKRLDTLLVAASGIGITVMLTFLLMAF